VAGNPGRLYKGISEKRSLSYIFITHFAFYLNDCIIEPFIVNRFYFEISFPAFIRLYCKIKLV